jgi:hypothetical protein
MVVHELTFVKNTLGIPWAMPKSVFFGSAFAWRNASARFPGYVNSAARNGALACNLGCSAYVDMMETVYLNLVT